MGQSIHDVLLALGAKNVREPNASQPLLTLDLELLDVRSVFGGAPLTGDALLQVSTTTAFVFHKPKELALCGTLWLPGVETVEAVSQAIVDAHDTLRAKLDDDQQSLKKLGFKPKLIAPEPRARALVQLVGKETQVAIDGNGDVIVESIDGRRVPSEHARVFSPEDVDASEAMAKVAEHVKELAARGILDDDVEGDFGAGDAAAGGDAFDIDMDDAAHGDESDAWGDEGTATASALAPQGGKTQDLSKDQLAELAAALDEDSERFDDDDDDDDDDVGLSQAAKRGARSSDDDIQDNMIDASAEAEALADADGAPAFDVQADDQREATAAGVPILQRPGHEHVGVADDDDDDDDDDAKTVSIAAQVAGGGRKESSLLDALDALDVDDESEAASARADDADDADDAELDNANARDLRRAGAQDRSDRDDAADDVDAGDAHAGGDDDAAKTGQRPMLQPSSDPFEASATDEINERRHTLAVDDDDGYDEPTVSALGSIHNRTTFERGKAQTAGRQSSASDEVSDEGSGFATGPYPRAQREINDDELDPALAAAAAGDESDGAERAREAVDAGRVDAGRHTRAAALESSDEDQPQETLAHEAVSAFRRGSDGDGDCVDGRDAVAKQTRAAGAPARDEAVAIDERDEGVDPARISGEAARAAVVQKHQPAQERAEDALAAELDDDAPMASNSSDANLVYPAGKIATVAVTGMRPRESAEAQATVTPGKDVSRSPTIAVTVKPGRTSDAEAVAFGDGEGASSAGVGRNRAPPRGPLTLEEPPKNVPTRGGSQSAEPDLGLSRASHRSSLDVADAARLMSAANAVSGDEDESEDLENALVARLGAGDVHAAAVHVPIVADEEDHDPNTARTRAVFIGVVSGETKTTNTNTNANANANASSAATAVIAHAAGAAAQGAGGTGGASTSGALTTSGAARMTTHEMGEVSFDDPEVLEARAGALEEEARALRERALLLRREQGRRPATTLQVGPPAAKTSLPVLPSMEVHAIDDLDDIDDDTGAPPANIPATAIARPSASEQGAQAAPPQALQAVQANAEKHVGDDPTSSSELGIVKPAAPAAKGNGAPANAASGGGIKIDEGSAGVSLAEVQAALGDVVALSGEQTQVAALRDGKLTDLRSSLNSADGDVFESAFADAPSAAKPTTKGKPTRVKEHDAPAHAGRAVQEASDDDVDVNVSVEIDDGDGFVGPEMSTRLQHIDTPRGAKGGGPTAGAIGLVVEDPRARDRLKKHLTPRFRRLVEAPDARTAAALPEVGGVEALVFVRPRPDDATRKGIVQLCDSPLPPRILIISSDARFDEMPEVSLRLPLGQRASEVAQQVLDGLRTLGVHTLEVEAEAGE